MRCVREASVEAPWDRPVETDMAWPDDASLYSLLHVRHWLKVCKGGISGAQLIVQLADGACDAGGCECAAFTASRSPLRIAPLAHD